eukprot:CAMPEP_0181208492 /NCGR_PEP_ID=MMETSP1096-20121128/22150_1 /TAXON_ID=156174 ORGANISM="Chrysochromulina ericina, Strain CCMP281" /NCGR_SAMPLE_ID=MMETSP1096 /ASSEMBLY_ACC=CAM_ASM_000453 /LENGTH=88 /DNA_ID=CAMNT_0023299567 /DNA_START=627 /DNA_END=893 /DNA_ORIENTATION=-
MVPWHHEVSEQITQGSSAWSNESNVCTMTPATSRSSLGCPSLKRWLRVAATLLADMGGGGGGGGKLRQQSTPVAVGGATKCAQLVPAK